MTELISIPRLDLILILIICFLLGTALGSAIVLHFELRRIRNLFKRGTR